MTLQHPFHVEDRGHGRVERNARRGPDERVGGLAAKDLLKPGLFERGEQVRRPEDGKNFFTEIRTLNCVGQRSRLKELLSGRYLVVALIRRIAIRVEAVREEMKEAVPSPRVADISGIGLAKLSMQPVPDIVGVCPFNPQVVVSPTMARPTIDLPVSTRRNSVLSTRVSLIVFICRRAFEQFSRGKALGCPLRSRARSQRFVLALGGGALGVEREQARQHLVAEFRRPEQPTLVFVVVLVCFVEELGLGARYKIIPAIGAQYRPIHFGVQIAQPDNIRRNLASIVESVVDFRHALAAYSHHCHAMIMVIPPDCFQRRISA
jgi:hypothetical protein